MDGYLLFLPLEYIFDGIIKEIGLSNGVRISCDALIWTVPLVFMFKAAGMSCKTSRPSLINTTLFHYVLDKQPLCGDHFLFCYDPKYSPFRVILYSNIQPELAEKTGHHRVTIEVLSNTPLDLEPMKNKVLGDLKAMGVVNKNAKSLYEGTGVVIQGFPVLSHEFVDGSKRQYEMARNKFKNLYLHGKNNTKDWFMSDIFRSVYNDFAC